MKKKSLLVFGIIVPVILIGIYLTTTDNMKSFESLKEHGNKIAMYIEDDDGNYNMSGETKFPTEGYFLNMEKSSCTNGGALSQNAETKAISLSVNNTDSCILYFEKEKKASADEIINKANDDTVTMYEGGNKGEMFTFSHEATTQTPAQIDYRYIGNMPNNYVTFNGETWRIIGVFETENSAGTKEQRIKIVRQEPLGDLAWDSTGSNEWSTASLKTLLNGDYYNRTGSYASTGLSKEARAMIESAKWYLGGSSTYSNLGGSDYYNFERGETTYNNSRTTNIVQNVGLIYPSDYIYTYANGVNEKCYTDGINCTTSQGGTPNTGWMFNMFGGKNQWTAAQYSGYSGSTFRVSSLGSVGYNYGTYGSVTDTFGVRPVVYLKSSIKLVDGDGTQESPYVLG